MIMIFVIIIVVVMNDACDYGSDYAIMIMMMNLWVVWFFDDYCDCHGCDDDYEYVISW